MLLKKYLPILNLLRKNVVRNWKGRGNIQKTIHALRPLFDLMLEKLVAPRYFYPKSPIVTFTIHVIQVQNSLVDLGASINVMKKEVLSRLYIVFLRETPTILKLVDNSTIKLDGMIENVIVTLNSLDYLVDFFILSPKTSMGGYPLILGRSWLATIDA